MDKINIAIGNKKYSVKLALTEEEKEKGLSDVDSLEDNEGMLFVYENNEERSFWMKDTKIPLDIIFISDNLKVVAVHEGIPESEDFITEEANFVLEVNKGSGIKSLDVLEFESEDIDKNSKMLVLDSEGNPQMVLEGGERIFSRPHTKILIRFAKKAKALQTKNAYAALGKRLFKFWEIQENTEPEFVEGK